MSDLISRQEVKEILRTEWIKLFPVELDSYLSLAMEKIENIPSAEKKGKWIGEGDGYVDGEIILDTWYCSNCNYCPVDDEKPNWNYCPNCGTRMVVDDE